MLNGSPKPYPLSIVLFLIYGLAILLIPVSHSAGFADEPNSRFVLGEVLVKFKAGTDASSAVKRATQPNLDALTPTVASLSKRTVLPLRAKQISGGDWVVLAIDLDRVAADAATQLRSRSGIADVRIGPGESSGLGNPLVPTLEVSFQPAAAESKAIDEKLSGKSQENWSAALKELGSFLNLPLKAEVEKSNQALLFIDLPRLTSIVLERLKAQTDLVEDAQLNYLMDFR